MSMSFSKLLTSVASCLAGLMMSANVNAGDCWLDVYDKTDFAGSHVRIEGPIQLPSLAKLNGENWSSRIESLIVGPKAQVVAFRQENFKEDPTAQAYHGEALKAWGEKPESYSSQEVSIGAGKHEHHLGELSFHRAINSLTVKCLP